MRTIDRWFEDYEPGESRVSSGRTITETDIIWFTLLTMNTHPLHFDNAYAQKTEFKRALVFLRRAFGDFSPSEKRSITLPSST